MKGFKKLLTGILAATMIMGASITAMAANTASITITNENNNTGDVAEITYNYYQVLKADVKAVQNDGAEQTGTAAYYIDVTEDTTLYDALLATKLFTLTLSADGSRYNVELTNSATTGEEIVAALNNETIKGAATAHGEFSNVVDGKVQASATVSGLQPGYYLVLSSLGTTAAIQTLGEGVTINEKNTYPTVTKEDNQDFDSMYDTVNETIVTYTVKVAIPASVKDAPIDVYDVATKGLTINKDVTAVAVDANGAETALHAYEWASQGTDEDGNNVYKLTLENAVVTANAGKTIVLTYTGTPNELSIVNVNEENRAYIEYDQYTSAKTEPAVVKTLGFKILKLDGADKKTALTGAEFTLWTAKENGTEIKVVWDADVQWQDGATLNTGAYRVATEEEIAADKAVNIAVDENGKATVVGLNATTYYLQEEVAPTGYNLLTSRQAVTVSGDKDNVTEFIQETVYKNSRSVLPSTGGIGTTIFYILGGVLIIAGVAYFILRRKAQAE